MKQRIKFIFTTWFIAISLFTINAQDVQTNKNDMENLNLTNEWDKTFPQSDKVKHSKVTFRNRYGITLAADLYMPKMPKANYTLQVEITGVRPVWTDKTKTIYGSDGTFVTIDNVYHF